MAIIVDFKPGSSAARSGAGVAEGGTCEIILFPGVRYERWEDTPPSPKKKVAPRKKAAKRRTAEMAD